MDRRRGLLLAADLPVPVTDPERVRQIVEQVLARPEYREAAPSLYDRIQAAIFEAVGRLILGLTGTSGGSIASAVVLLVAVVVVGVLIARYLRGVRRDPEVDAVVPGAIGRRAADWRADAAEHEAAGRWRDALRCHYRALLAELAAVGLIDEVPGRTTGEYLAAVRGAAPTAGGAMAEATVAFDAAWYGEQPVTADAVARFRRHAGEVLGAAGRHRVPAEVAR